VTELRSLMLEEIQRRNLTESTRRAYVRVIKGFAVYLTHATAFGRVLFSIHYTESTARTAGSPIASGLLQVDFRVLGG
jgi:hypothetical protein